MAIGGWICSCCRYTYKLIKTVVTRAYVNVHREPRRKRGIEVLCMYNSYVCLLGQSLIVAASGNHPLLNSVAALVDQP